MFGNWIQSASMKRMTSRQATQRQPTAFDRAVAIDGFHGIFRTTGRKPTMLPDKRTEQIAVCCDETDQDASHKRLIVCQCFSRRRKISWLVKPVTSRRKVTTRSTLGKMSWFCRKLSRTRRLIRLRATAVLMCLRAIASPRRVLLPGLFCPSTIKYSSLARIPVANTRLNSLPRVRRWLRLKRWHLLKES